MGCCVGKEDTMQYGIDGGGELGQVDEEQSAMSADDDTFVTAEELSQVDETTFPEDGNEIDDDDECAIKQDPGDWRVLHPNAIIQSRLAGCRRQQEANFPELSSSSGPSHIMHDDSWSLQLEKQDPPLKVYCKTVPANENGAGMTRWRAVANLPVTLDEIETCLFVTANRLQWAVSVEKIESLHRFQPRSNLELVRFQTYATGPISSRDFVTCIHDWRETLPDGRKVVGSSGFSVESAEWEQLFPLFPEGAWPGGGVPKQLKPYMKEYGGCVRGKNFDCGGWRWEESGNGTVNLYYVIQSDIGGWLPGYVIDAAMAGTFSGLVKALTKFIKKQRQKIIR